VVDAKKQRYAREDALALLAGVRTLVVANRGKVVREDLKSGRPEDDALAKLLLGPSGNLRAPTLRLGTTMLVGFDAAMYADAFG
jgi:hypothetical protein